MYDDAYNACLETFVTLRIYHDTLHPDQVTNILGIIPTEIQLIGEQKSKTRKIKINRWFLSTKELVNSKDSRRHIDELLRQIVPGSRI